MESLFAKASPELSQSEVTEEEIQEVVEAWNEPIPEHLIRVGGYDLWTWVSIHKNNGDPPYLFHGEFRDRGKLFIGDFIYNIEDSEELPEDVFKHYYITDVASREVQFRAYDEDRKPVTFTLVPMGSQNIFARSAEAQMYRSRERSQDIR